MRVLVTGGAGFIGSHVVDRLIAARHAVAIVDDLSTGSLRNLEDAVRAADLAVYRSDIRSRELARAFEIERPEIVIHLAAQINVRTSMADPVADADVNILGTLNVLERARESGTKKVVALSSGGAIYGDVGPQPVDESARGTPSSAYGISKRVAHDYLELYRTAHGLASAVVAPANVYGPRQGSSGEAGVVAIFLRSMLLNQPTIIYGDGTQSRDLVAVSDVTDAILRCMERGSGVFNVGTGRATEVLDLWEKCATLTGYEWKPRFAAPLPGDVYASALDAGRARRELGWTPRVSLDDGLALTAESIRADLARAAAARPQRARAAS